jgi:hypothetical protein
MIEPLDGVHPMIVGEALYQFTSCILRFCDAFVTNLSPHQFKIVTKGECELVIHGIRCTLNFFFDWVGF